MGDWNHPATSPTETTAVTTTGTVSGHMTVGQRTGEGGSELVIIVTLWGQGWNRVVKMGYYYYTIGARMGQGGTKLVIFITLWGRELDRVGQNSQLSLHYGAKTE